MENNIKILYDEIAWLTKMINQVISCYLMHEKAEKPDIEGSVPDLSEAEGPYAETVKKWELDAYERLALALSLSTYLSPEALDVFFVKNQIYDRGFTEFGGVLSKNHCGFLPTGQTLNFLISSLDRHRHTDVIRILSKDNILMKERVLELSSTDDYVPNYNGVLSITRRWYHYFVTGEKLKIEHSESFPAKRISTNLEWEDVVLPRSVMAQINEIKSWITHGDTLMNDWGLYKMLKPGFRALFYGVPGTGKTLTATLLGKSTNRDVYKVDLSMIVSKYIGETEKNLAKVFDIAQYKDWILFFDEADALFGRRTEANTSNDRHANQQTAYLLQRIEDFPGIVILASNLKANMDDAFTRRFQSMISFKMPNAYERHKLWKNAFSGKCQLDPEINLESISEKFELTGGAIINVLRYCALAAIEREDQIIHEKDLINGIRRELHKENKTI